MGALGRATHVMHPLRRLRTGVWIACRRGKKVISRLACGTVATRMTRDNSAYPDCIVLALAGRISMDTPSV